VVDRPNGKGGERLHDWVFNADSDGGVDAEVSRDLLAATGAVVVGRRTVDVGVGLWGDTPFPRAVLCAHAWPRQGLVQKSGTFTFVTNGIESAMRQAQAVAGERNVLLMGSANVAQQFMRAGLVDEIQLQLVPVLLGAGTRLFELLGTGHIELERTGMIQSPRVTHLRFRPPARQH
jgi:dihydrofolate reductase